MQLVDRWHEKVLKDDWPIRNQIPHSLCARRQREAEESSMSEKSGFVWAVKTGDLATVQDAVSKGENVNAVDATVNKRTPLHHAADFGQTEVINFLIQKGAKVIVP